MKKFRALAKFWLPVFVWLVVIFGFSTQPTPEVSKIDWRDFILKKTIHLVEFGILFILFYRAFKNTSKLSLFQIAFWALILTILYSTTDEFHQTFIHGRTGTLRDIVIDSSGAGLAWFGIWKYLPKAPAKLRDWAKKLQIT